MGKTKTDITLESLLADGWKKGKKLDLVKRLYKKIPNRNPLNNTPEDTTITLVVHGMYNGNDFAILFPDGGLLNIRPSSMDDLKVFERMINFYDCPF